MHPQKYTFLLILCVNKNMKGWSKVKIGSSSTARQSINIAADEEIKENYYFI